MKKIIFNSIVSKWSRLKNIFIKKISNTIILFFIFGSIIRFESILKRDFSYLADNNSILKYIISAEFSNHGIVYVGMLIYIIGYLIYKNTMPRDIEVSDTSKDYVTRSMNKINHENIIDWYRNICEQLNSKKINFPDQLLKGIFRYKDYYISLIDADIKISIDKDGEVNIFNALLARYDYYNNSKLIVRLFICFLLIISSSLILVSSVDILFKTLTLII
jgi:hypothetical protein